MSSELYIGVMSGTSLDGVDIALCEISSDGIKLLNYKEYPFEKSLKDEVLYCINNDISLQRVGELDTKLGVVYARLIDKFLQISQIDAQDIKAIGLHGQTLWHSPKTKYRFSMQLGDANIVAQKTSITTVSDFRRADIAHGGEGAPFAPVFHQFLYGQDEKVAVLNIGGMANITLLGEKLLGWDSGCGNVLLDYWMMRSKNKSYDKDGEFAKSGKVDSCLLDRFMADSYFKLVPPKSTGREHFNQKWLEKNLKGFKGLKVEDIQRTLLELTAKSISDDIKRFGVNKIVVCGGGSQNGFLMQRVEKLSGCEVVIEKNYDALEAMAFAYFAYKRVNNEVLKLSSVTGAKKDTLSGAIYG